MQSIKQLSLQSSNHAYPSNLAQSITTQPLYPISWWQLCIQTYPYTTIQHTAITYSSDHINRSYNEHCYYLFSNFPQNSLSINRHPHTHLSPYSLLTIRVSHDINLEVYSHTNNMNSSLLTDSFSLNEVINLIDNLKMNEQSFPDFVKIYTITSTFLNN